MAGLPWFELDTDFHEDPKVKALCSRLREPLADAYVARLYAYCYRHAQDRFDPAVAADTIEDAVRWKGRRGVLFDALFACEVLERDAGKVVVHGVKARLGPHLAKRQADAERQQRRRDKAVQSMRRPPDVTRDVTPDITRESRGNRDMDRDSDQEAPDQVQAPLVSTPLVAFLVATYPDIRDPAKAEAAWTKAYPRIDLLAEALKAHAWETAQPSRAKKNHGAFLNRWFSNATPPPPPAPRAFRGDRWQDRLTPEEFHQAHAELRELAALDPDIENAPLGCIGADGSPAREALQALNERWREVAEAR